MAGRTRQIHHGPHRTAREGRDFLHENDDGPVLKPGKNPPLPDFGNMGAMANRRKISPGEDLFELVAMLPRWGGVALALITFVVLHGIAGQQVNVTGSPGQLGSAIAATLWKSLAGVGQYILPIICLAAALGSALSRRKRQGLMTTVASSDAANALDGMTWREFEMLVGEAFRMQGYRVAETGGGGADGGVDLVLRKERETFLVQCKQWRAYKVGVTVVRELFGVMAAKGAAGGFVVTSGRSHARRSSSPAVAI
jgi:restriction system protein